MTIATGNFSVTCPTLPRGIRKEDLTYDAPEHVRDACRRHLHRYAMKHSAPYRAMFAEYDRERAAEAQANDDRYLRGLVKWANRTR